MTCLENRGVRAWNERTDQQKRSTKKPDTVAKKLKRTGHTRLSTLTQFVVFHLMKRLLDDLVRRWQDQAKEVCYFRYYLAHQQVEIDQ